MKSIFKTLFDLKLKSHNQPLEDYLTELFAHCLRSNKELFCNFMVHFNIAHQRPLEKFNISTQHQFKKIDGHHSASRPDMIFSMDDTTVFFENKVHSSEGWEQLTRYADHLSQFPSKNKTLVYLTRNYEDKDKKVILKNSTGVKFLHLRWYQIAHFFESYPEDPIVEEFLKFMKETKIAMSNKIMPTDILAMSNFNNVLSIMEQTMSGDIANQFKEINGSISRESSALKQISLHDRYIYYSEHYNGLWTGFGFHMNSMTSKDYPETFLIVELDPGSNKKDEILAIFKEIDKADNFENWKGYNLNIPTNWFGVKKWKSLREFLSCEDQLEKIQEFFKDGLDELKQIYLEYPTLLNQ